MSDDIVARLRLYALKQRETKSSVLGLLLSHAADEIERLRAVVEAWLKYSQRAERDIETLRAERDELRQRVTMLAEAAAEDARRMAALERMIAKKEPIL